MSRFNKALVGLVKDLNQAYERCLGDLKEVVGEVGKALRELSSSLDLRLAEEHRDADYTSFQLVLSKEGDMFSLPTNVGYFQVRVAGYPLFYSSLNPVQVTNEKYVIALPDREALEKYFESMLTNKNSQLVTSVAFLLRG